MQLQKKTTVQLHTLPSRRWINTLLRAAILSIPVAANSVFAQQNDVRQAYDSAGAPANAWQPYVSATYINDDNLLRTPTAEIFGAATSDTSYRAEAGTVFDKTYSRQHITASIDVNRTIYERFRFLDYDGKDAQVNWNWGMTKYFTGNLGSTYTQTLTPFTTFHAAELNLSTQKSELFDTFWHMTPSWQLHGSITESELKYDLISQQPLDRNDHIGMLGLDYVSAKGNTIGLALTRDHGVFPPEQIFQSVYLDNNYTQNDLKMNLDWTYSGLTHIQFTGGWARREYDTYQVRDVSGPSVRLTANWIATGKTMLNLSAWRDISASNILTASYTVDKGLSINPIWDVLPKIRLQTTIKQESFDYTGASVFTSPTQSDRIDTLRDASLSAVYTPLKKVQITMLLYTDQLKSTLSVNNYRDKGITLNTRVSF